jgi:hypothetical protein
MEWTRVGKVPIVMAEVHDLEVFRYKSAYVFESIEADKQ